MDFSSDKVKAFVIHESRNDIIPMIQFLREVYKKGYTLVGYNCNGYDNQLMEYIFMNYDQLRKLDGARVADAIYGKSQWVISLGDDPERYLKLIPEWNFTIPHIDIYKQKHYDGAQKRCGLKWLEFTMRFPNIESMPLRHYDVVDSQKLIDSILKYNLNDVAATKRSFEINKFETDLRIKLSEKYGLQLMNASEPKLAREIFGHLLAEKMGIDYKVLKRMRTDRDRIYVKDIIFPYVKFKDPILIAVKEFFEGLDFCPWNFELNNYGLEEVFKTFKYANIQKVKVGLGGLHACAAPGVYESGPNWKIKDIDGASFYPNLGIKNQLHPEHLPPEFFCTVYDGLYEDRKVIPKEDPVNYAYKIILNATYGQSCEANNFFCDPKYGFTITINGQLLLLKLAELLKTAVPGVVFYQINTDGISFGYDPKYEAQVEKAMKLWEKVTKISLDAKEYAKMIIMDVNNYMAIDTKGKVKRKGRVFAYSLDPADKELDYHKNPSSLVIPMALEQYFLNGTPVEEYITSCKEIYDFCIGVKLNKDFDLIKYQWNKQANKIEQEIIHEQVVRFFVSKDFISLKKKYRPGTKKEGQEVELAAKFNVTMFNVYQEKKMKDYNVNYKYYIRRAKKIIDAIQPNSTNLKLF